MTFNRLLTFILYAGIILGAIGHIVYLWPDLTARERFEICIKYGAVIIALAFVVF